LTGTKFTALGEPGHGSKLLSNTAGEKILKVMNKLASVVEAEKVRVKSNSSLDLGDLTTINLSILEVCPFTAKHLIHSKKRPAAA